MSAINHAANGGKAVPDARAPAAELTRAAAASVGGGGAATAATTTAATTASSPLGRAEAAAQGHLQRLDPIAWAICRKPLRQSAARALCRVAGLVGASRSALAPLPSASTAPPPPLLELSPACARLEYLPVQTPPLHGSVGGAGSAKEAREAEGAAEADASTSLMRKVRKETRGALSAASTAVGLGKVLSDDRVHQIGSLLGGVSAAARGLGSRLNG